MMEMKPLKAGTSRRQVAWLSVPAMLLLFVSDGAIVGAIVDGIIGARMH